MRMNRDNRLSQLEIYYVRFKADASFLDQPEY